MLTGRAVKGEPRPWLRGPATFEDGWIVLDRERATEYQPYSEKGMVFELAAVQTHHDALAFVQRYGLLRHGPDAQEWREPLEEWQSEALTLRGILYLLRALRQGLEGDMEDLRARWRGAIAPLFLASPENDQELLAQAAKAVALVVSEGLENVEEGIAAMGVDWEEGSIGEFRLAARPRDLLGYVYHELAMLIVNRAPLNVCAECGRVFPITDPRQKYCSSACGSHARYRRWRDKHAETK